MLEGMLFNLISVLAWLGFLTILVWLYSPSPL